MPPLGKWSYPDARQDLLDGRGLADDVRERRLGPDFFLKIEVLLLEPVLEPRDLFVREHILDGQDDLVRDRQQELGIGLPVPPDLPASDVQRPEDPALHPEGHRKGGEDPLADQRAVLGEARVLSQVGRQQGEPAVADPA